MKFFKEIKHDLPSSVIVFFVALPLCLGIALASGAPLFSGLIAGIVGGIVVGSISGSSLGVSGPAAGLAVIVLSSIQELGSFEAFLLAVVFAGIIQLILGLLKAGFVGYFFPSSVIKGMLSGIGFIIILKQIPHAFGYDSGYEMDMKFKHADGGNTLSEIVKMLDYISLPVIVVSATSLFIILFWDNYLSKKAKFFSIVQGPIVAVAFGIIYEYLCLNYFPSCAITREHLVNVPVAGDFNSFLSQFSFPDFSLIGNYNVYVIAFTLAVVASLETLLSVEATDKLDPIKRVTPTNRELIAQGAGNVISGLIGGLPITQVIVRSSANIQSGAKTKLSGIIHGFLLLISVIVIPQLINYIPLGVLASILFVVGFKLAKPSLFKHMYQLGYKQFVPFIITILGIVFTDLLSGIAIGLAVSIFFIVRDNYKNSHFMHIKEKNNTTHLVEMTLSEEVSFLNKGAILKELNRLPFNSEIVIDLTDSIKVDYDVYEIIENFRKNAAPEKNIKVVVKSNTKYSTVDY
ncbi:MAG: SulP family inorganic anion transporter [Bacteroidetes bacterium]|nr:MAG: SulP family inorganic anion transporter [Bacteroidota bacterium]MBL1143386.1 SulP family inorganic anion transporter [Bacteroidota bacterium]NOG56189.1 SulP family inorganic anion transporter [Bacteroidota bacterium]